MCGAHAGLTTMSVIPSVWKMEGFNKKVVYYFIFIVLNNLSFTIRKSV